MNTKYSDDHSLLEDLHGTVAEEVDGADGISLVEDVLARCTEHRLHLHRNRLQAPTTRRLEDGQIQHLAVQVGRHVALHLDRKISHHLSKISPLEQVRFLTITVH